MRAPRFLRRVLLAAALAAVYTAAGKLGLMLAVVHPSATAVWPGTAIGLAALVVFGDDLWPVILASAFLVNVTTAGTAATSLGIACGNTLEALAGAYLLRRLCGGRLFFERASSIFLFALVVAPLASAVSATVGVTSLVLGGVAAWSGCGSIWLTWWLGDLTGALVLAPALIIVASAAPASRWTARRGAEAAVLLVVLVAVGDLVFGGLSSAGGSAAPLHFLCIPVVLYVAFRFGLLETTVATVLLSLIAIAGTLRGHGPFRSQGPNESLLVLQAFLAVLSATGLVVAAVTSAAEAASRMKSEFLGLVSHELRTPLTALQLQMERLRRDPAAGPDPRQSQILAAMSSSVRRLADLIEGLLQYMRVERGGYRLAAEPVAVEALVSEALEEMRLQAERKGLTLRVETSELPPLFTDPSLLRLVVTNLVGNAIKFTSVGGVEVRLGHRDGAHRIAVVDTGPGIASEDQRRVFEPFEQLSPMRRKHLPGFGLGLALARDVTKALGGHIELASAPGTGSTFTVVIPGKEARAPRA